MDAKPSSPNNRVKLAKKSIEALPSPPTGYVIYWISDISGLGLRVTAGGTKSYILQRRIKGREKRITIGRYPDLTPDKARKKAERLVGEIADDGDPLARMKREDLQSTNLEESFQDYFKTKDLKASTVHDMKRSLSETFGDWKKRPLVKITRRMVEKRYLEKVEASKARTNAAFRYLRAVFNLAAVRYRDSDDKPIIEDNPVRVLSEGRLWRKIQRRRTVLSPNDLKLWVPAVISLGKVPNRDPGKGRQKPKLRNGEVHRDLLLFMSLTGCRKGEALGLKKGDADLQRKIVVFRDTKNRTDHELPLTDYLANLLKNRMAASKGVYIFASPHDGRPVSNLRYAASRITQETNITFTPHDLRRLAASTFERLGVPAYTIKAILNHRTGASDVTGGYVQVDSEMKLAALIKLERFIMSHGYTKEKVIELSTATHG